MILPQPTKYKGIVFASKTEALFARTIDIAFKKECYCWFYNPQYLKLENGYVPDFTLFHEELRPGGYVIEIKPKFPNEYYLSRLCEDFKYIQNRYDLEPVLAITNFFNFDFIQYSIEDGWCADIDDFFKGKFFRECAEKAKNYRFDLE